MHYGIEAATHPYTCIPLQRYLRLSLPLPFSLSSSFFLRLPGRQRETPFIIALSCSSNTAALRIPVRFISSSYAAFASPLCRRGVLVSHHFADKSALYSFIPRRDGFAPRARHANTHKAEGDARLPDRGNEPRMNSGRAAFPWPHMVPRPEYYFRADSHSPAYCRVALY